MLIEENIHCCC